MLGIVSDPAGCTSLLGNDSVSTLDKDRFVNGMLRMSAAFAVSLFGLSASFTRTAHRSMRDFNFASEVAQQRW